MGERRWIATRSATARIVERLRRALAPPARAYEPWIVEGHVVGWIIPERVRRLAEWRDVFRVGRRGVELAPALGTAASRTGALDAVARRLSAEGALTRWRDERYAVSGGDAPLFELERAAARYFGIRTSAAHANGLVEDGDAWRMWLARRSAEKPIDPGRLDNLVGGGIAAGCDARATLVKEAFEEAGIEGDLASCAQGTGAVEVCRDQPDGLQRETIHVYDLWLPPSFVPRNQDGEAVDHRLCAPEEILEILGSEDITGDASLVIVDFLLRHGHVSRSDPAFGALDGLRHPTPEIRAAPDDRAGG